MSIETLHPGLYAQEVKGLAPMEGVSTSTAGFVGVTERGEIGKAKLVTNWTQFVTEYGGFTKDSYLAYSVRQFFENGGVRAYITRVVHTDVDGLNTSKKSAGKIVEDAVGEGTIITVEAKTDGKHANTLKVDVVAFDDLNKTITLAVLEKGSVVELFKDESMETLDEIINKASKYINVEVLDETKKPKIGKVDLTGGKDGIIDIEDKDFIGDEAKGTGLFSFNNVKINMVAISGQTSNTIHSALISYVEGRKDCVAVLDAPIGKTPQEVLEFREAMPSASSYANLYYPWEQVSDPIGVGKNPTKLLPPSGAMMGVYARTDNSRGVHKSPAGVDATLLNVIGLEYNVSDEEQDILNPAGINCIRAFPKRGIVSWGARTLSSDSEFKYVSVRRHQIYIAESLLTNMDWTVFEPNDEKLWGKITSVVSDFLRSEWKVGALKGTSENEAFYVKCDAEINTPEVVDAGRTYVDIGVAEQKPAEFIIFRIGLKR